jgi:membrane fusion protein, multidrug efflux system
MKGSVSLSLVLLLLIGAWMASGSLDGSPRESVGLESATDRVAPRMKVLVQPLDAAQVGREILTQGQLEPRRRVEIRAETAGRIVDLPTAKGQRIRAGDLLARLAEDDRRVQIARAQAEVANQELAVAGHRSLKDKGLQAETQLKAAEAALAAARAELERLELDLAWTRVLAPFDGVLETRLVELGSLVERGDTIAELVDDGMLLAVGYVPQQSAGELELGQTVLVRLLDGRQVEGRLSYLARVAESGTRSFRIEAEVANRDRLLPAGVSAELRIQLGEVSAHFLSPAALTLDDAGRVGIKSVGADETVDFHTISMIRTEANGIWVAGLPEQVRVIVQGQGFVTPGEVVEPVEASATDERKS